MKRFFLFASALIVLAGCASNPDYTYRGAAGPVNSATDAGYGSGVAPTQQGAGAAAMTYIYGCDNTAPVVTSVYTAPQ